MRLSLSPLRLRPHDPDSEARTRILTFAPYLLAGLVGLTITSRANVWFGLNLSRGPWTLWWGLTSAVAFGPLRYFAGPIARAVSSGPRSVLAVGLVAGVWWNVALRLGPGTNVWVLPRSVRAGLAVAQSLADVTLATLAVVGLTVFLRAAWRFAGTGVSPVATLPAWPWRAAILPTAVAVVALNALVAAHVAGARFVPYWDYGVYWTMASDLARTASERPDEFVPQIASSVAHNDYNLLPALIPALAAGGLGESWPVYLHALATAYGGAVAGALFGAVRRTVSGPLTVWACAWPAALVATTPLLWMPTLRGYADLGAIAFAVVALGLYLGAPARNLSLRAAVALGVALAGTVLYRRWMSIWVVAFVAVAVAEMVGTIVLAARRRRPVRGWFAEARGLVVAGAVAATIVLAVATPLVLRVLTTDYAASYVAYRVDASFAVRATNFLSAIGWAYPLAFAAAAAVGFADARLRRLTAYAVAVAVVAHVQFHRIQDLSLHHRMLYAPSYLILLGAVGVRLIDVARGIGRPLALAGLVATSAFGLLLTTEPGLDGLRQNLLPLAPGETVHPIVHPNPDGLIAFAERANREALSRHTTFAVIASSCGVNQTYFFNAHRALGRPRPGPWRQEWYGEVDKVGGFPQTLFTCGVIVVAEPVQLHLNPREQINVSAGTGALVEGTTVGAAFRRLPDAVELAPGVRAWLFVRARPFAPGEVEAFCDILRAAHPDWPMATEPSRPIPDWPWGMSPRD